MFSETLRTAVLVTVSPSPLTNIRTIPIKSKGRLIPKAMRIINGLPNSLDAINSTVASEGLCKPTVGQCSSKEPFGCTWLTSKTLHFMWPSWIHDHVIMQDTNLQGWLQPWDTQIFQMHYLLFCILVVYWRQQHIVDIAHHNAHISLYCQKLFRCTSLNIHHKKKYSK